MLNEIEDDFENENLEIFYCNLEKEEKGERENNVDQNIDDAKNNLDENLNKNIKNILEEINVYSEDFVVKIVEFYKKFKFNENDDGIKLIKKIINDAYNYSKINLKQRIFDFFDFISTVNDLKLESISQAINNITIENIKNKTNEDIIYFWKEYITEDYIYKRLLIETTKLTKDTIKSLLQENYNITEICNIFLLFKKIFNAKQFSQIEIINSLISIIISYNFKIDDDLIKIINDSQYYIEKNNNSFIIDSKIVLDFYLKASKNGKNSKELNIQELLYRLKNMNSNISEITIQHIENQTYIIQSVIKKYKNYKKEDFQKWAKKEFPELIFNQKNDETTAIVLGMISLVIYQEKGYHLRNAQLIAILMFIGKEKNYGLIEEISTGEGKSCIICSLSIYYALKKKK